MNVYQRGTAINLIEKFWTIDPLTQEKVLADPTTVVFTIKDPNGQDTVFTFGVDGNVLNPTVGVYVCMLDPQLPIGIYHYLCVGTGAVQAEAEDVLEIVESGVLVPDPPKIPVLGPTYPWISGQDVAACTQIPYDDMPWLFDDVAFESSQALYEVSGRRFPGVTDREVRPAAQTCGCWGNGPISYGMGPWYWSSVPWGFAGSWGWWNEAGQTMGGCKPVSRWRLGGYPVHEIVAVTLNGEDLPEFDSDNNRNWRLDKWRYLVRMDQPAVDGVPGFPRVWPGCQNMSLDDDQPGTFSVTYKWGVDPPLLGRAAAIEIANQLFLSCGAGNCVLPAGVTKVIRQGIEIDRSLLANWMDTTKGVGLVNTDLFLMAYNDGQRRGRRPAVFSPDIQQFARVVGRGNGLD